ncbi:MAG: 2TM domain-containing protein [Bacteroidota bacterium]
MARKKKKWGEMTQAERKMSFNQHFRVYLVMSIFFFLVNVLGGSDNWWFYWPVLGWGIAVAMQALSIYGPFADTEDANTIYEDYGHRQLNGPPTAIEEGLELKELDKRYKDDDLV